MALGDKTERFFTKPALSRKKRNGEILRQAQNDDSRRARNDNFPRSFLGSPAWFCGINYATEESQRQDFPPMPEFLYLHMFY